MVMRQSNHVLLVANKKRSRALKKVTEVLRARKAWEAPKKQRWGGMVRTERAGAMNLRYQRTGFVESN